MASVLLLMLSLLFVFLDDSGWIDDLQVERKTKTPPNHCALGVVALCGLNCKAVVVRYDRKGWTLSPLTGERIDGG